MSDRIETTEYNLYYEEDGEFEYEEWTTLEAVEHFLASLKQNPAAAEDVAQAVIVRRQYVTFTTDWEPVGTRDQEDEAADARADMAEVRAALSED